MEPVVRAIVLLLPATDVPVTPRSFLGNWPRGVRCTPKAGRTSARVGRPSDSARSNGCLSNGRGEASASGAQDAPGVGGFLRRIASHPTPLSHRSCSTHTSVRYRGSRGKPWEGTCCLTRSRPSPNRGIVPWFRSDLLVSRGQLEHAARLFFQRACPGRRAFSNMHLVSRDECGRPSWRQACGFVRFFPLRSWWSWVVPVGFTGGGSDGRGPSLRVCFPLGWPGPPIPPLFPPASPSLRVHAFVFVSFRFSHLARVGVGRRVGS